MQFLNFLKFLFDKLWLSGSLFLSSTTRFAEYYHKVGKTLVKMRTTVDGINWFLIIENIKIISPVSRTELYSVPAGYMRARLHSIKAKKCHNANREKSSKIKIFEVRKISSRRFFINPLCFLHIWPLFTSILNQRLLSTPCR